MKKQILLSAGLILGSISFAQNLSASELFQKEGIHLRGLRQYVKNEQVEKIGRKGKFLKEELKNSPEAMEAFEEYEKNFKRGNLCGTIGVISGAGIVASFIGNKPVLLLASSGVYLGSMVVNMIFTGKAQNKLEDAVHIRNRDLLKEVK